MRRLAGTPRPRSPTGLLERVHQGWVVDRRARCLARHVSRLLPQGARILDVGCGDGSIARSVMELRPDVGIRGIDTLVRAGTSIPVEPYDGAAFPLEDRSVDVVTFIDVLHHTPDPTLLLREAVRVARTAIVVKDHTADGFAAVPTLRLMDFVGNARHGVVLPYNYWPRRRWKAALRDLGLRVEAWETALGLYPWPASLVFERSLHFVARLSRTS